MILKCECCKCIQPRFSAMGVRSLASASGQLIVRLHCGVVTLPKLTNFKGESALHTTRCRRLLRTFTETSSSVKSLLNLQQTTCAHHSPIIHPWHPIYTTSIVISYLAVVPSNLFMLPFNCYSAYPALRCSHIKCVQSYAAAVKSAQQPYPPLRTEASQRILAMPQPK